MLNVIGRRVLRTLRFLLPAAMALPLAWSATPAMTQSSPPPATPPAIRVATPTSAVSLSAGQSYYASAATRTLESDIHPLIRSAARRLNNDPDRIYEFVRNAIDTEPMFGLQKGAVGTLVHRSGTAFDQAELMVKLLRAAAANTSTTANVRYRYGVITLTGAQFKDWMGTDNALAAKRILDDGGFPNDVTGTPTVTQVQFLSVWVETQIAGTWYAFNPAIKAYSWYTPADFKTLSGYNRTTVRAAAGVFTVSGANAQVRGTGGLSAQLASNATTLASALDGASYSQKSPEEVLGGRRVQMISRTAQRLTSLPEASGSITWDEVPDAFRTKITVTGYPLSGSSVSVVKFSDQHYADLFRVGSTAPTTPPNFLWLDLKPWNSQCYGFPPPNCSGQLETLAFDTISVTVDHPYAADAGLYADRTYVTKTSSTHSEPAGGNSAQANIALRGIWLSVGRDSSRGDEIYGRQAARNNYCLSLGFLAPNYCPYSAAGDPSLSRVASAARLAEGMGNGRIANHHAVAFVYFTNTVHDWSGWNPPYAQNWSYAPGDAPMISVQSEISVTARTGVAADRSAIIGAHATLFQAAESISMAQSVKRDTPQDMWDEYTATGTANRYVWINSANYTTQIAQLSGYTTTGFGANTRKRDRVQAYVNAGYTVLAPKLGTIGPTLLPNLRSAAFWAFAPDGSVAAVYVDPGTNGIVLKGAGASRPLNAATPTGLSKQFMDEFNRGLFDPSSAFSVDAQSGQSSFSPPVLLSTGSGDFPRRLDFKIKITGEPTASMYGTGDQASPRLGPFGSTVGSAGLGNGTVYTSLEHDLSLGEDLDLAFGSRSPAEASSAIVAAMVSGEEFRNGNDALSGLVVVGSEAWLGHQLEDGVATLVHGVDGIEKFTRAPNGTWRAPPDSLETLAQTGSPVLVPPFNRRGYRGTTFLWRARDGATKSFKLPTPGTATGQSPLTPTEVTNCASTGAEAFEKAYWGVNKGFEMDTWTMPGGEWVKAETIAGNTYNGGGDRCSQAVLKRLKNNYGRYIEFAYDASTMVASKPYVFDENGRTVSLLDTQSKDFQVLLTTDYGGAADPFAPTNPVPYQLGFLLPMGQKLWIEADNCHAGYKSPYAPPRTYCDRQRLFFNDPNNPLQTVNYDPDDAGVKSIADGDGVTASYAVLPGYRFAVTDAVGNTSSSLYDEEGRTVETLSAGGKLKTYAYDGRDRVTDEKLFLASAPTVNYDWTSYAYDLEGRKTDTTAHAWMDPSTGLPYSTTLITTHTTWNTTWNQPATVTDPLGKVTTYTYSSTNGLLTQVDGPTGERTITEYDSLGRVYRTRVLISTGVERITQLGYDSLGNLTSTTLDPTGTPILTSRGYDLVGNLTSVINPRGYTTTATFDGLRRLTQVDGPSGGQTVLLYGGNGQLARAEQKTSDPLKPAVTTWEYLASGRVRTITDPESHTTIYTYDAAGRIRYVDDPVGRRTETTYTSDGETATTTGGLGSTTPRAMSITYYPDGGARFQRDGLNAITGLDFGTVENLRDPWGRPSGIRYGAGGQYETITRDLAGNITQVRLRDAAPASGGIDRYITYTYDDSNRQLTKTAPTTTATKNLVTTNAYDLAGELLSATFSDDRAPGTTQRVGYVYAAATGRLSSETWWEKYGTTTGYTTGYSYDPAGNRTAITWPDAFAATYAYNQQDQLTQVGWTRPGGSSGTFAIYTPDPQGQIASIAYTNGVTATVDRLTGGAIRQIGYSFPSSGSLTLSYGFNTALQQTYEQASDNAYAFAPATPDVSWSFNAVTQPGQAVNLYNQYEQATITTAAAPATVNYSYDAHANLTSNGSQIFIYDHENRLERVTTSGGADVVKYDYDPAGRRSIKAITAGAKTAFVHAGDMEIADLDPATGTILRRYIPGAGTDQWAAFVDEQASGAIKYVHQNKLGSVIALSNSAGSVAAADRFVYDPYGVSPSATAGFPFRYTGQRLDPETGLYYYRARYYDPRIGRFLQTDPIGVSGGGNLYGYVSGNPLDAADPTGLTPYLVCRVVFGIGHHCFVVVTNQDGSTRTRFSYAASRDGLSNGGDFGNLVAVTGSGNKTDRDDQSAWDHRDGQGYGFHVYDLSELGYKDDSVVAAGRKVDGMLGTLRNPGSTLYSALPSGKKGIGNSNSASFRVLHESAPPGASAAIPPITPGAEDYDQIGVPPDPPPPADMPLMLGDDSRNCDSKAPKISPQCQGFTIM